jgi:hypothetical protein
MSQSVVRLFNLDSRASGAPAPSQTQIIVLASSSIIINIPHHCHIIIKNTRTSSINYFLPFANGSDSSFDQIDHGLNVYSV